MNVDSNQTEAWIIDQFGAQYKMQNQAPTILATKPVNLICYISLAL